LRAVRVVGFVLALVGFGLMGCRSDDAKAPAAAVSVSIRGSDTMVRLTQLWAEQFMRDRPGAFVQVSGGGSGAGLSALINGTADVCQASRRMRPQERALFRSRVGGDPVEIEVARDGLAIFVHPDNPIGSVTSAQLRAVFRGHINNWRQLGGRNEPIVLYIRESSSGSYLFFKDTVMGGYDYAASAQPVQGTGAVVDAIKHARNGIGYGGAAYGPGLKVLGLSEADRGVRPSADSVRSGAYPLSRSLYYYLARPPRGSTREFIDWVLSPEGQALVEQSGYYPRGGTADLGAAPEKTL